MGYETAGGGSSAVRSECTMNALAKLATGPGHMAIVERPEPRPGPGEVVIEVHGAGVCGTDLHIAQGEYDVNPVVTLGHELCGVVVDVGDGVSEQWHGRTIVAETFFSTCRTCRHCRDGRPNLCPRRHSIGTHVDGAFAPRVLIPASNLHATPPDIDEHSATLTEPLACVCQCLLDPAAVLPGDRVLVTGPGAMGLLSAQLARLCGGKVVVSGLPADEVRLEVARQLGFQTEYAGDAVDDEVDVAIECSGSAAAEAACLMRLHRGGRLVQVGIFGSSVQVPLDLVLLKELEMRTGFASTPRSWMRAMALIEHPQIELDPLVTRVLPLERWEDAFKGAGHDDVKIVLDPRG